MSVTKSSAKPLKPSELPRIIFQRGEGGLMYADVNQRVMEEIGRIPPEACNVGMGHGAYPLLRDRPENEIPVNSTISLYLVSRAMIDSYKDYFNKDDDSNNFYDAFGVTRDDQDAARQVAYGYGFAEMEFPWEFAASIASVSAQRFVEDGYMTPEQHANMTLKDWANIIGSGWFSDLMHNMAYTKNSIYKSQGRYLYEFDVDNFRRTFGYLTADEANGQEEPRGDVFKTTVKYEPQQQKYYAATELTDPAISNLRRKMRESWNTKLTANSEASHGCPAARSKFVMPAEVVTVNPHVRSLINSGRLKVDQERSDDEKVTLVQPWTPIEISLAVFARKLDEYSDIYGEPVLGDEERSVYLSYSQTLEHVRKPDQNALIYDLPPELVAA